MKIDQIIQAQYLAALEMLKQAIVKCPAALWNAPGDQDPVWRKAYHALFYVHFYLQANEQAFTPWEKHHDPQTGVPFSGAEVLEYQAFVQNQVREQVPRLELAAESGFHWLPFNKLELQFYNLRHLQQHVGELYERLGSREMIELDWVGTQPA
jgi:hypothetical protein